MMDARDYYEYHERKEDLLPPRAEPEISLVDLEACDCGSKELDRRREASGQYEVFCVKCGNIIGWESGSIGTPD